MFGQKTSNQVEKLTEEIDSLRKERRNLKQEVEDLKLKKKIEHEDIKHMVKMKEQRLSLDFKGKELDLEKKKNDQITTIRDEYRDKVEKNLEAQIKEGESLYKEILNRLPDISVKVSGKL